MAKTETIPQPYATENNRAFCKIPDGTMICYGTAVIPEGQDRVTISYDTAFKSVPVVAFCTSGSGTFRLNNVFNYYCIIVCNEGNVSNDKTIYYIAVGRWK